MEGAHKKFTLFGSRLLFWLLAPWVIAGALFFPYLAYQSALTKERLGVIVASILALLCIFILLMAIAPKRFGWLSILVSGSIAGAYLWYFIYTFFIQRQPIKFSWDIAEATPLNAILGFCVWGLPSLFLTIRGIRALIDKRKNVGHDCER